LLGMVGYLTNVVDVARRYCVIEFQRC